MFERIEGFGGDVVAVRAVDTTPGIGHLGTFERIAVVTHADWLRRAIHLFGALIPGDVRSYTTAEVGAAEAWIRS